MSVSRWLGIVGGVLLCVSAFTPLRSTAQTIHLSATSDPMVVDGGAWMLVGAGVLAVIAALIGHKNGLIAASCISAAAAAFVAGSLRASIIQLYLYADEAFRRYADEITVPDWGWLLVVGGVVLVTAAAILAKVPHNSQAAALRPVARPVGD